MTGFPDGASGKELTCQCRQMQTEETWVQSPIQEDSLEEGMATHSSILAWKIPWTEAPGRLQSIGFHRVEHNRSVLARRGQESLRRNGVAVIVNKTV